MIHLLGIQVGADVLGALAVRLAPVFGTECRIKSGRLDVTFARDRAQPVLFDRHAVARIVPGRQFGQRRVALRRKRNRKPLEHRSCLHFRMSGWSLRKCLSCSI